MILQEDDFKEAVPVYDSMAWGLLKPSVEQAENDYLLPLLGTTTFSSLDTEAPTFTGNNVALYAKLKAPLAQMVAYLAAPDLDLNLGTHGFTVHKDENSAPASQSRVNSFRTSQLRKAMSGFDRLLLWLETNKATYADWAGEDGYTELKQGFVNTTAEFNALVDINSSRYLFMRLRPYRRKVEQYELKSYLGEDLYNEIKAEILAGSISADNTALLPFIHEAVANRAIAKGILPLNLEIGEHGYLVSGMQESTTMNMAKKAADNHIDTLVKQYDAEADAFFEKLRTYLNANASATKYAVYFNSDLYVDPNGADPNEDRHQNQAEDPLFIF